MYSSNSTDTVPVLHYGIPLEGINPPVTVYIHRALRTIGQHSIEGNIVIMIIYSYQLLGTTLVHPLASTTTTPVPSTGATPVPMDTGTGDTTEFSAHSVFITGQSSQYNCFGPPAPKRSKLNW